MRLLIGSIVGLALLLGLICCVKPTSSYGNDEFNLAKPEEKQVESQVITESTGGNEVGLESGSDGPAKRSSMGMPSSARELSLPSDQQNGQPNAGDPISAPANVPLNSGPINSAPEQVGQVQQPAPQQQSTQEQDQEQEPKPAASLALPPSTGRGMIADALKTFTGPGLQLPTNQQNNMETQQGLGPGPQPGQPGTGPAGQVNQVRPEDLPKIIENDKPVSLQQQQAIEEQKQKEKLEQGGALSTNLTLPTSSARTFDSWTNCVGSSTSKYGTCKNDVECNKSKGRAEGSCMGGFGVCCVMALTCGEKSLENNTFFANPDHPEPSWEARLCEVEVKKKHSHILQVMIEFEDFELAPPNQNGECITDVFQVKLASHRPSPYSLLRICGQNTGQHLYLDVSQIDEPLVLSVATSGGGFPRRWSIRIVQMDEKNFLLAPPGCLQYYTDTIGHFRSFNMGRNLRNLYYAICFRIDNGYSGIRFTENFFGMNGPFCRRKGGRGGLNSSIEAHPHHLVIPPPGYARPPPGPGKFGPGKVGSRALQLRPPIQQQGGRFKRWAYSEPLDRSQRTLHEHEHEHEKSDKDYKGASDYAPRPPPPPPPGYGPPPPPIYGGYGPPHYQQGYHEGYKKGEYKEGEYKEKGHEHESKGWLETFGWSSSKQENKQENKYENKYEGQYPSTYPPPYGGPHHPYGPPPPLPPKYGPPGYGPAGYGAEYHHKEIDKFGKQYEHLEYKHEQNHHKSHEHEKSSSSSSSWWPSWGSSGSGKEKTKSEKFFQHHEALFPMLHIPEMPHCEPRFCGQNDVITFPPSGDSISEMCGNKFNRGRGPKIISGSPLVVYVSNRGHNRGGGFDINYEQVFYIPRPYKR